MKCKENFCHHKIQLIRLSFSLYIIKICTETSIMIAEAFQHLQP